jgi:hypothetical protein
MMRRLMIGALLIAILGLVSASRAQADGVDLTFNYEFAGNTFIWHLPASPGPIDPSNFTGDMFAILSVSYIENDMPQIPTEFDFFSFGDGGGFEIIPPTLSGTPPANTFGAQLYSGTTESPTFTPGIYHLNNDTPDGPLDTLIISTPEPSSLMLLGSGLLALLGFARKKIIVS